MDRQRLSKTKYLMDLQADLARRLNASKERYTAKNRYDGATVDRQRREQNAERYAAAIDKKMRANLAAGKYQSYEEIAAELKLRAPEPTRYAKPEPMQSPSLTPNRVAARAKQLSKAGRYQSYDQIAAEL